MPKFEVTCRSIEAETTEIESDNMQVAAAKALAQAPADFIIDYVIDERRAMWQHAGPCQNCGLPKFTPMGERGWGHRVRCGACGQW